MLIGGGESEPVDEEDEKKSEDQSLGFEFGSHTIK